MRDLELKDLKVAIVHNWFWSYRGGERALNSILKLFPDADIYALFGSTKLDGSYDLPLREVIIRYSFLNRIPVIRKFYKHTLFLWPFATKRLDLTGYDLIVSNSASTVKAIRKGKSAVHVCYLLSPMRYIWDSKNMYEERMNLLTRTIFRVNSHFLRIWDVNSNSEIDWLIAISRFVAKRAEKYWGRRADSVVYPPVTVNFQYINSAKKEFSGKRSGLISISSFQENKAIDKAIKFAKNSGETLNILGDGPGKDEMMSKCKDYGNIKFHGWLSEKEKYKLLVRSEALLFLGVEDFGIVPIEGAYCGIPVIALGKGGALESVKDGISGVQIENTQYDTILDGLKKIRSVDWDQEKMMEFAEGFSEDRFHKEFMKQVEIALDNKLLGNRI